MATKLDPHHLVALMNYAFKDKQDGSPRRLDPSLHTLKGGTADHHETNVRTIPILDALAHISVSQKEAQVVAIGLQLNSQKKEIRLTVAENKKVTDGLVNHLTKVWGKLQTLSGEYERDRGGRWDRSQPRSPEMPKGVGLSLKKEIFRDIYQYSLEKQMKRIDKWSESLGRFVKELLRRRASLDIQGFELSLYKAVFALSLAVRVVSKLHDNPNVQLTESEWELFGCEILAQELRDHPSKDPFRLRRALEKLTSLPCHIETLFGFAHSPRLRPVLRYRLFTSALPKKTHAMELPASPGEWKSFLEVACHKRYDFHEMHAVELAERFGSSKWVCPVHCECGLIQYLRTRQGNQWDHVPPFSYIGVSKLSCSACRIWMEALNERTGQKFYTRSSHGKWYWPWGIPRAEGPLVGVMARKVLDEYLAYLVSRKLLRSGSESSGTSSAVAEHGLSDDHEKEAEAVGAAIVQGHGGSWVGAFDAMYPDA
ncbi:hypothetical protein HOY80DRAFT_1133014 [Tuber brumale]|nr:hypothetical protein HOY80DRAFT_1133014 [Tuber brumale]